MLAQTHHRFTVLVVSGLAIVLGACGSSSNSASPPATAPSPPPSADKITAIPSITTGSTTTLTLDPSTAAGLTSLKVAVTAVGTATAKTATGGTSFTFPQTSGYAEIHSDTNHKPGTIEGSIEHFNSGLRFTLGAKFIEVTNFVVDPGNSILYATVDGVADVPLLVLDGTHVTMSMSGPDVVLDGTVARLTPEAAQALDQTFSTGAATPGLPLGTAHLVINASNATTSTDKTTEITQLTGLSTSVTLDPSTATVLKTLGVTVAPSGSATFDPATATVSFRITGGFVAVHSDRNYKPGYIAGVLIHQESGLTLSKGTKSLNLSDFVVDPADSTLTGTVGGKVGVPLLSLNGAPVKVSPVNGSVHLDGTIATLTGTAATALNATFATTAFKAGLKLGVVHIIASGE